MEVNALIKGKREELGLTLRDVAQAVGVSESTVLRWESGDIENMKRDKIVKLAQALQISPATIMGWDDDLTAEEKRLKRLMAYAKALSDGNVEKAIDYMKYLSETQDKGE